MFDAVVLAGGAARRLGGVDKPAERVGGISLLGRVVSAVGAARRVVVVGPRRTLGPTLGHEVDREVAWRREVPVGAGPVAAIAAGLAATSAPTVVVVAADLPDIAPAIAPLLTAVRGGAEVALLADADGRPNYLAGAWRRGALQGALQAVGALADAPVRALVAAAAAPALVPDAGGWGRDCDTWDDLAEARQRHDRRNG